MAILAKVEKCYMRRCIKDCNIEDKKIEANIAIDTRIKGRKMPSDPCQ